MKKKIIIILFIIIIVIVLFLIGGLSKRTDVVLKDYSVTEDGKILIAFFSRADENYKVGNVSVGNTEIMAGFMKDYLGTKADIFKIDPVTPYPVDYKECTEVATKELNSNARPAYKGNVDISKYDTIILGYPIWWGTPIFANQLYNVA